LSSLLQPRLTGKLLELHPLQEDDFPALFAAASDPDIWEQHPDRFRYQEDVFKKYFKSAIECRGGFLIKSKSGEVIGSSRYYDHVPENKEIKVGFTFLTKKYWGGPFNRELKHLMLSYAFEFADTVHFEVGGCNIRSQKAMANVGATLVETKERTTSDGKIHRGLVYRIRKSEFDGLV
jgi:N-acetyltransferase